MRYLILTSSLAFLFVCIGCDSDESEAASATEEIEVDLEVPAEVAEEADDGKATADEDEEEMELPDDLAAGATEHFGEPFTIDGDPISLGEAIDQIGEDGEASEPLKLEATVALVCQNRGCWFTLDDDEVERPVRIRMKDYGFFVPRNATGASAIIEGTIEAETLDEDDARHHKKHVAEQTGEELPDDVGELETYKVTATGITMTLPES